MKCFKIADVVLENVFLYFKFLDLEKEIYIKEEEFLDKWGCIDYFLSKYLNAELYKLISSLVSLNFFSWDFYDIGSTLLRDDNLGCIHRVRGTPNGIYFINLKNKIDDCFNFSSCFNCFTKVSVHGGVDNFIDDADFYFYFSLEICYDDCINHFDILNKIKRILGG